MIRTSPPRGRAASRVLFAVVALVVVVAVPAAAAGDLSVSASERVTGRDPLVLAIEGLRESDALVVDVTDAHGDAGTWRYPAGMVDDDTPLPVDLAVPDEGSSPRNGSVQITVTPDKGTAAETTSVVDRAPPAPQLRTVVRDHRVGLTWDAVAMPDPVTYRLERIAAGGSWAVIQEGAAADGHTDRALDEGRYRYRLSAAVRSADGDGRNWSALSTDQIRITSDEDASSGPAPQDTEADAEAGGEQATPGPAADKPEAREQREPRQRPRNVAATGGVRGPVANQGENPPQLQTRSTPLRGTARQPALDHAAARTAPRAPAVAPPQVAAPATDASPAPDVSAPRMEPFPVTVPPGSLAVQAATQSPPDPVTLLTGLIFLLVAAGVAGQARRRSGRPIIRAWAGRP